MFKIIHTIDYEIHGNGDGCPLKMMIESQKFVTDAFNSKYNKTFLGTAYFHGKLATAVLSVSSRDTTYNYIAGSDYLINNESGAANMLFFKMLLHFKKLCFKFFDLVGTPINPDKNHPAYGVYLFKQSFGHDIKICDGGYLILKTIRGHLLKAIINNRSFVRFIFKLLKYR